MVNLCQYENLQKDNIKLAEEFNKFKKIQGSGEMAPIVQKLKQQIREKDDTITVQKQEINDIREAQDKVTAELSTLRASYDNLRKKHVAQRHELNTAKDNIDTLLEDNTKAQATIKMLMNAVQAKQNSFNDILTAYTDLQAQFNTLKNSMDTLDKQ